MPKISIIVPVYNVEQYLSNCIDSILNQTFKNFELILVNDGSTDNSLDICKHYKDRDDRICIIDKENGGLSSARNAGLDIANGEYIGFVDSDDYIHPQMYELLYKDIVDNKADISLCGFKKVYDYSKYIFDTSKYNIQDRFIECLSNIEALEHIDSNKGIEFIVAWNKLYKKELFNNLRYKLGMIHEDEFIIHRILYRAKKVVYTNIELYFYMQRDDSIMGNRSKITRVDYLLALSDRIRFFYEKGLKELQYEWEKIYLYNIFNIVSYLSKYKNQEKIILLRKDFSKLIKILNKNNNYSFKEKIMWRVFCINPSIYIEYTNLKKSGSIYIWLKRELYVKNLRKKLKNKDLSVIASNCNGGFILSDLGVKFNTPTINLFFYPEDFLNFISDIKGNLKYDLIEEKSNYQYPIGRLNNIKIHFMHYKTFEEAKEKWNLRKNRINYDNLFIMFTDRDGCTYEQIKRFNELPYKNKVMFTHKYYPEFEYCYYIEGFENNESVGILSDYIGNSSKRYLHKFDFVKWFNQ